MGKSKAFIAMALIAFFQSSEAMAGCSNQVQAWVHWVGADNHIIICKDKTIPLVKSTAWQETGRGGNTGYWRDGNIDYYCSLPPNLPHSYPSPGGVRNFIIGIHTSSTPLYSLESAQCLKETDKEVRAQIMDALENLNKKPFAGR